jgi:RHS repeat-associated protein
VIDRIAYSPYGEATRTLRSDVNGDGFVNQSDYTGIIRPRNGAAIGTATYVVEADLDRNGVINQLDYDISIADDGKSSSGGVGEAGLFSKGVRNSIGYCGYIFNEDSGLYTVRFRTYSPTLGRWLERDPAGYVDGMGLYEYVRGGATSAVDPWGLWTDEQLEARYSRRETPPNSCGKGKKRPPQLLPPPLPPASESAPRNCDRKCPPGESKTVIILGATDVSGPLSFTTTITTLGWRGVCNSQRSNEEASGRKVELYTDLSREQVIALFLDPCVDTIYFVGHSTQDDYSPNYSIIEAAKGVYVQSDDIKRALNGCRGPRLVLRSCFQGTAANLKSWEDALIRPGEVWGAPGPDRWWYWFRDLEDVLPVKVSPSIPCGDGYLVPMHL